MNKEKAEALATDIVKAISIALIKHGISESATFIETDGSQFKLTITPVPQGAKKKAVTTVTPNAVARYKANKGALCLPDLGTEVKMKGMAYKLAGLSSDYKRIKATRADTGDKVHDLPLQDVIQAVALQAGAEVANLNAKDNVEDVAQAADLLASLSKKTGE